MSKRLQVVLDDAEYQEIRGVARRARLSVSEWVRQALREARRRIPSGDADRKLQVVRAAIAYDFPTADIDQMLREIDAGYGSDSDE
jgi:hypothetical protein